MMRVGISVGTAFNTAGPRGQREGPLEVLGQAQAANRAGLDSLTLGTTTSPVRRERGGTCRCSAAFWRNGRSVRWAASSGPVVASGADGGADRDAGGHVVGQFIVQTGLGGGATSPGHGSGAAVREAARFEEGVLIVQALLRGEAVDRELFEVARCPESRHCRRRGAEWSIGGGVPKAIERATRLGDCWYGNADLVPDTAQRNIEIYREACARLDRRPVRIPIRKDVLIAEDRARPKGWATGSSPAATGGRWPSGRIR